MKPVGAVAVEQRIAQLRLPPVGSGAFAAELVRARAGGGSPGAGGRVPASGASPALAPAVSAPASPPVAATARPAPSGFPSSAAGVAPGWGAGLPTEAQPWLAAIEAAAGQAGIDPRLLAALVQHESGFRADARSHAGAIGLGQLMPATASGLGVDPHDPVQNLQGAARYLREQLDRFGSVELAAAAYNAGPGRVAQAGGIPRIPETQQYVSRVVGAYDRLRST